MSEYNKNLQDDLNEMLGDAKEGAKKAADKASEMANEAKEKISQFTEEAKEKASEFAQDAKQAADEFTEDAEQVLSDGKNVAIIAHLTIIGWVIALVMNGSNRTEMGSFYIKQMLGFMLLSLVGLIPIVGWILSLVVLAAWLMSLVSALGGKIKPSFLLGQQFQEWFKGI
ncbi:YtxH domain-containing protein [Winogradskyella aurantiaca]|uniref:YtxH domain-containing protein n=1 Tax=Winogradskyella aurantiaca TaxID=2219558 RepID=UPI000E1DDA79|nr:YtxH domain-containing protein [Winogradskyella aurantiaca]